MLDAAAAFGVSRVVTFAAMAAPVRPDADPRVFAGATHPEVLDEFRGQPVEWLDGARISGLNGVLLACAARRGMAGMCLLGEFPFFASGVAHPKTSAAVLRGFARLSGIAVDVSELDARALEVEAALTRHLERLEAAVREARAAAPGRPEDRADEADQAEHDQESGLPQAAKARIEALFERAAENREAALELESELDRRGVFDEYEDCFLDLFKQGE